MNRLWNVIKRVLGYEYETGSIEYNDLLLKEKKKIKPTEEHYNIGFDPIHYNTNCNDTMTYNTTILQHNGSAHRGLQFNVNESHTSYDQHGVYQYYWNEKGEYVKEYIGGVNNSKL